MRPSDMRSSRRPVALRAALLGAVFVALVLALALTGCSALRGGAGSPGGAADAARLALAQQDRFRGIGPLDASLIGQAAWYQVTASSDGWEVLIRIGWGDCPAGCVNEHRWTYAVRRDGTARLVREAGDNLPDATGVRGKVTGGPTCPVVTNPPNPACADRPVGGAVLVFADASGTEVARVTSGADGTFSVALAPGSYRLTAEPVEGLMGTPSPMDVGIEAGQPMLELTVSYDTGIR